MGRDGGRRTLLPEKLFDSDTRAHRQKPHLDTNRGLGASAEAGCSQSSQAQGGDFFFFSSFFLLLSPPFSFMDSLLLSRMTLNRAYSNPFRP